MSTRKRPKVYQLRLSEDEGKQLDFYAQSKQISAKFGASLSKH